jgi:hypothetical protein
MKARLLAAIAALLTIAAFMPSTTSAHFQVHLSGIHPVIFVHGGSGSGSQFESQALRFESNGYSHEWIAVLEYDSSSAFDSQTRKVNQPFMDELWNRLDALIAQLEQETGATQVDILGHSLGTTVMQGYINSSAERAKKLAHYVNIDGGVANALPGTAVGVPVPTLALWAGRPVTPSSGTAPTGPRQIVGALNVTIPDVTHVQCATSPLSFVEMYKFFTGFAPRTSNVIPQDGSIELAGRAVIFPQNVGAAGVTLQIWRVDRATGHRVTSSPDAVYAIDESGNWGPFHGYSGQAYEFNLVRGGGEPDHPTYFEPFVRSDYLIRLNTQGAGGGISATLDRSPNHVNLVINRNQELWGDQDGENDVLLVNGVNVITPATNPITKLINAMFIWDKGSDGVSHIGVPVAPYSSITFFTGEDVYIPGNVHGAGTTSLVLISRTGGGIRQVVNVPNIASTVDRAISVTFNDYVVPTGVPLY